AYLTSAELRRRLLDATYTAYLGHAPDAASVNFWLGTPFTFTLAREGLLSSLEFLDARKAAAVKVAWDPNKQEQLQGQSLNPLDQQFSSFMVGKPHVLNLTVGTTNGTFVRVQLEDEFGTVLAATNPGTGANTLRSVVQPGRTYFLRVRSSADALAG